MPGGEEGSKAVTHSAAGTYPIIARFLRQRDTLDVEDTRALLAAQYLAVVMANPTVTVVLHLLILERKKRSIIRGKI